MGSADPYLGKKVSVSAFADKRPVRAEVVAVLRGQVLDRNMSLIPQPSRAVKAGDVHEIILTDEAATPGADVGRVAYLAFVKFLDGGIVLCGDKVYLGDELIAELIGYDLSHFPNHMNIVARGDMRSGEERGLRLDDTLVFVSQAGLRNR